MEQPARVAQPPLGSSSPNPVLPQGSRTFPLHATWLIHVHMHVHKAGGHHRAAKVQHMQVRLARQQRAGRLVPRGGSAASVHGRYLPTPHMHCSRTGS